MKVDKLRGLKTKIGHQVKKIKAKLTGKHGNHEVASAKNQTKLAPLQPTKLANEKDLFKRQVEVRNSVYLLPEAKPLKPEADSPQQTDTANTLSPQEQTSELPLPAPQKKSRKAILLAKFVKSLISLGSDVLEDKEEVKTFKARKKEFKSACDRADKELRRQNSKIKKCRKELSGLQEEKSRAEHKHKTDKVARLQEQTLVAERELAEAQATSALLEEQCTSLHKSLEEASLAQYEAQENGEGLIRFGIGFASSLRDLHKLKSTSSAQASTAVEPKVTFKQPRIVLQTDDGKLEIRDLELVLKTVHFKANDLGKQIPVLGIDRMSAHITIPLPCGESLNTVIELMDVDLIMDTGLGAALHSYVTADNSLKALSSLLLKGAGSLGQIAPRAIEVSGKKADITLEDCRAASFSGLVRKAKSTPGSAVDKIFQGLGFNLQCHLQEVCLDTRGEAEVSAHLSDASVNYEPEPFNKKQEGVTHRRVRAEVAEGRIEVTNGLPLVQAVLAELTPENPLQLLPGLQTSQTQAANSRISGISETFEATAKNLEIGLSRELQRKKKGKKLLLTGCDQVDARVGSVRLRNSGSLSLSASAQGLEAHVKTSLPMDPITEEIEAVQQDILKQKKAGKTDRPSALDAHKNKKTDRTLELNARISSAAVTVDAPENLLPDDVMNKKLKLSGQASFRVDKSLEITARKAKNSQEVSVDIPEFRASVTSPLSVHIGEHGAYLPKDMTLKAKGGLELKGSDSVLRLTPDLTVTGNDRMFIIIGGTRLPIDMNTTLTLEKAHPRVFKNDNPETGESTFSPVITSGCLKLQAPNLGPLKVEELSLNLDDDSNGELRASGIEVNFDTLTSRELVRFRPAVSALNDPRDEDELSLGQGIELPWLAKKLLRHKKLQLSAGIPIRQGLLELNGLRTASLKFANTPEASLLDRTATRILNFASGWILRRLQQFRISFHESPGHNGTKAGETPVLTLEVGPFTRQIPLPVPEGVIDRDGNSIPVMKLLRQNTGIIVASKAEVQKVESCLSDIMKGSVPAISTLTGMVLSAKDDPARSGLIQLIAEQLPTTKLREILGTNPQGTAEKLYQCAEVFLSHPELHTRAMQLFALVDQPLDKPRLITCLQQAKAQPGSDPTGLGLVLEEQQDPARARECYMLALERQKSTTVAHERLGLLAITEYRRTEKKPADLAKLSEGLDHLLKAWQAGSSSAADKLLKLETDRDPRVAAEAKLRLAAMILSREESARDFDDARERLEELTATGTQNPVGKKALTLLKRRCKDGEKFFHTGDKALFEESQLKLKELRKILKKKKGAKMSAVAAYDLGVKLAYGAHGVLQEKNLARRLLNIARENGIPAAAIHLAAAAA